MNPSGPTGRLRCGREALVSPADAADFAALNTQAQLRQDAALLRDDALPRRGGAAAAGPWRQDARPQQQGPVRALAGRLASQAGGHRGPRARRARGGPACLERPLAAAVRGPPVAPQRKPRAQGGSLLGPTRKRARATCMPTRGCGGALLPCPKAPMSPPLSLQEGEELPEVWRARLQAMPEAARPRVRPGGWLDFWTSHPDGQARAIRRLHLLRPCLLWLHLPWRC